jgi:hypothetical protein
LERLDVANNIGDNFSSEVNMKDLPYTDALKMLTAMSKGIIINDSGVVPKYLMEDIVLPEFYNTFARPE